jgi:flagellar protein FlbD
MILVHRLRGEPMFINADLIESIEATPDTVVTMIDNRRMVVQEAPEEVVVRIQEFRAALLVAAANLRSGDRGHLVLIDGDKPDDEPAEERER